MKKDMLSTSEIEYLTQAVKHALHENYVLKAKGETDEDCMTHDIIAAVWRMLEGRQPPYRQKEKK